MAKTPEQRILAIGAPAGIKMLLASVAGVYPADVSAWVKGRIVAPKNSAAVALDAAMEKVEYAWQFNRDLVKHCGGLPLELNAATVKRLYAQRRVRITLATDDGPQPARAAAGHGDTQAAQEALATE
jgi:hypothetical protein